MLYCLSHWLMTIWACFQAVEDFSVQELVAEQGIKALAAPVLLG